MTISFIIPLFNCLALTQAMLTSLRATIPAGMNHEIIFVDDGSTDGTREWLTTLAAPCRSLVNQKNLGFAGSCNRGADSATGKFIFFLNNDLVLPPRWLKPMLAAFERIPSLGLIGNVQRIPASRAIDHTGIYFDHKCKPAHATDLPLTSRLFGTPPYQAVDAVTGACFGIRASTWKQLGGFDEGFINGSEDVDLCLRAKSVGLTNYVALTSVVWHHVSQSKGRKLRDEQNSARLAERWVEQIPALATRAWSRRQIASHADQSHVFDTPMIYSALAHGVFGLPANALVRAGTREAFEAERQRWRELLHGSPALPPPPATRTAAI